MNLEISLVSYSNPSNKACNGGHCEASFGDCDPYYDLQLVTKDSSTPLYKETNNRVGKAFFSAPTRVGITESAMFSNLNPTVRYQTEIVHLHTFTRAMDTPPHITCPPPPPHTESTSTADHNN